MSKVKTPSGKIIETSGNWKNIWRNHPEDGWFEVVADRQSAFFFGEGDECVYWMGRFFILWDRNNSHINLPNLSSREDVERWIKLRSFE